MARDDFKNLGFEAQKLSNGADNKNQSPEQKPHTTENGEAGQLRW